MSSKEDLEKGLGITTLAGSRFKVFLHVSSKYGFDTKYAVKWLLSGLVSVAVTILSWFDGLVYTFKTKPKDVKPPVFIIGHGRSGTTLLHNLMCLDPEAGYTTTFQSVFPNNMFAFKWLFKGIMKMLIPDSRPVDNVKLHVDYPQEEEFALGNETHFSFYNWWYFPLRTREIANEFLLDKTTKPSDWKMWKSNYQRFVNRGLLNTNGSRFISKNPPHTARIPQLLEMYPDAKFVYIHRNPYEVVQSTQAFYQGVLPTTQVQDIEPNVLLDDILYVYSEMITKYEKDKALIPEGNLVELEYSDLVQNPVQEIESLYDNLLQDDFTRIENPVKKYVSKQSHGLKTRKFENDFILKVNDSLSRIITRQGYELLISQ